MLKAVSLGIFFFFLFDAELDADMRFEEKFEDDFERVIIFIFGFEFEFDIFDAFLLRRY